MSWSIDEDIEDDWLIGASYTTDEDGINIWFSDPADPDRCALAEINLMGSDLKWMRENSEARIDTYGDLRRSGFFLLAKAICYI